MFALPVALIVRAWRLLRGRRPRPAEGAGSRAPEAARGEKGDGVTVARVPSAPAGPEAVGEAPDPGGVMGPGMSRAAEAGTGAPGTPAGAGTVPGPAGREDGAGTGRWGWGRRKAPARAEAEAAEEDLYDFLPAEDPFPTPFTEPRTGDWHDDVARASRWAALRQAASGPAAPPATDPPLADPPLAGRPPAGLSPAEPSAAEQPFAGQPLAEPPSAGQPPADPEQPPEPRPGSTG